MDRKHLLILAAVVLVALAGCSGPDVSEKERPGAPGERLGDNIAEDGGTYKYMDNDTGAVCYVVQNAGGDPAIDCVIPETNESD